MRQSPLIHGVTSVTRAMFTTCRLWTLTKRLGSSSAFGLAVSEERISNVSPPTWRIGVVAGRLDPVDVGHLDQ